MKSKENLQLKIGAFIVIGVLMIGVVIFLLGNERNLFNRHFSIYARFNDISGLRSGAPVYLVGIHVGQIKGIYFSPDLSNKAVTVEMNINRKFQDRIRADSVASIQTEGLLGDKVIFLSVGTARESGLRDGDFIQTQSQVSISDFVEKGTELLDNLNHATGQINKLLDSIQGSGAQGDVTATLKSLRHIFAEVEQGNGMLHALIYGKKDERTMKNIEDLSVYLRDTAKNLQEISDKIKAGEGTIGGLVADPTVYYDLKTLLDKANRNKLLRGIIRSTLKAKDEKLIGETK